MSSMTPERWQQVERIFGEALEREPHERSAYLDQACAGDEALRKEVESLLASHAQAESFDQAPGFAIAAQALTEQRILLPAGQQISHYKIIREVGRGGMGEVYLAKDTRLGRNVALKVLPSEFTTNKDRLRRFEQEARTASTLSHPNIAHIYEVGEAEGHHYIAMEYVEGVTLRLRMANGKQLFLRLYHPGQAAPDIPLSDPPSPAQELLHRTAQAIVVWPTLGSACRCSDQARGGVGRGTAH